MDEFSIGQVAGLSGFRASAIRYYEKAGILSAPPRSGGRRVYSQAVLDRLAIIRFARYAGFTVAEIAQFFRGFPEDAPASARWHKLARRKLEEVDALIARAHAVRKLLQAALECRCLSLDECGLRIREAAAHHHPN